MMAAQGGAAGAGGGAMGGAAGAGGGARSPVAAWIDPDLLEAKCEDCVCPVCFGVMVVPTCGCPGGHCLCRACYQRLLPDGFCPTCCHPIANEEKLVRIRPLEGMISGLRLRCENAAEEGDVAAGAHEAKKEDAGCRWRGCVGEFAGHLLKECQWEPVKCPNKGCTESPLRKDLLEHDATCGERKVRCGHCYRELEGRSLAEHEGICPAEMIECPNVGCSVKYSRGAMSVLHELCLHELVSCPCPGCDARLFRKNMDAHVGLHHLHRPEVQLQSLWRENARLAAASESEQRHASVVPSSWVFNWQADGWGQGKFESESHDFGAPLGVKGHCVLLCSPHCEPGHSHFIGCSLTGIDKCKVHITSSILDKNDKTLRKVHEIGTANTPVEIYCSVSPCWGSFFTPTAEEKAQSVRADGSIRLRVEMRLFLVDGAAGAAGGCCVQ